MKKLLLGTFLIMGILSFSGQRITIKSGSYCNGLIEMPEYDDDYECYVCTQDLDEDEMVRFVQGDFRECPYYQVGDEYRVVRKQM